MANDRGSQIDGDLNLILTGRANAKAALVRRNCSGVLRVGTVCEIDGQILMPLGIFLDGRLHGLHGRGFTGARVAIVTIGRDIDTLESVERRCTLVA